MSALPDLNLSTAELFLRVRGQLTDLEGCMMGRRNRDKACTTLTDVFLGIEALGRRLQTVDFSGAPVCRDEEETVAEAVDPLSLADLFSPESDDEEAAVAVAEGLSIEGLRLRYFRQFLDYITVGAPTADHVMKKLLAFARRVRPQSLAALGLSQAAVGRALGESRAVVHAREKRVVEELLKDAGARGFHGLGGQRGEETRERCSQAQMGNENRKGKVAGG